MSLNKAINEELISRVDECPPHLDVPAVFAVSSIVDASLPRGGVSTLWRRQYCAEVSVPLWMCQYCMDVLVPSWCVSTFVDVSVLLGVSTFVDVSVHS